MRRLFVGPTGVYLLDFFCSGIQFYLLLSPYLCFISLLCLDLYILGDDALVRGLFKYECKWLHNFLHIYATTKCHTFLERTICRL